MSSSLPSSRSRVLLRALRWPGLAIFALAALALPGCVGSPPAHQAESAISAATGLPEAVTFRTEGAPLDESPPAPDLLTLADAVRRAVSSDPGLQASLARVRLALAGAEQARALPNPVLDVALRFPEGGGSATVEATLAQEILSIFTRPRRADAADHRLRAAAADSVAAALDVVTRCEESYATVQALESLLAALRGRLASLGEVVAIARSRLSLGEGTRGDLLATQAGLVEVSLEIARREQELRDERLRLSRLIGEPSGGADWRVEDWRAPPAAAAGEAAWVAAGLAHRPELLALTAELAALGDDRALASWHAFDGTSLGVTAEGDEPWELGPELSLPIPLFDAGGARRDAAEARRIEARHSLVEARRGVVEEVRRAFEHALRSRSLLERVRTEWLPLLEERRAQAESALRLGGADATALRLAESDLGAAQAERVDLERQVTIAELRLRRAVGGAAVAVAPDPDPDPDPDPSPGSGSGAGSRPVPGTDHTTALREGGPR